MKCPNCKTKIKKEYTYCYSCGNNIKKSLETKRILKDVKSATRLGIFSMILVLCYPTITYLKDDKSIVEIKKLLSGNDVISLDCSRVNDDYNSYIHMNFILNKLINYNVRQEYINDNVFNTRKDDISKFIYETGINYNVGNNKIIYEVSTISIINEAIYDFDNIKLNYQDAKENLEANNYICK